ncbi:hypothetical protein IMCC3317_14200 [Kordia antarctica]|uniref:Uncharacterized protein n=1 Tax=Kordia antarctica TaxID=1218801 RepID=A0A7L4ZHX4_9FLAO|nr:hypothetical protein [Kordia antarctica]QHI36067.1 hypothetical protein IMCC3317_14200 [Kordia antarctica]
MNTPINIHDNDREIYLSTGIYGVKVLGGWSVKLDNFSISLELVGNNTVVTPNSVTFKIQSYVFKKRAKKIFSVDIIQSGNYRVKFKNQESLKIRRSNLFLAQFFEKEIFNEDIEIFIGD